jgi:hypothetical protein
MPAPQLSSRAQVADRIERVKETIRDYIKRRVRWAMAAAVGAWLLVLLTGSIDTLPSMHTLPSMRAAAITGGLVFVGAVFFTRLIKCPKCSTGLGRAIVMRIGTPFGRTRINFCPFCGVRMDDARP